MKTNELAGLSTVVDALTAAWNPPSHPRIPVAAEDDVWEGDDCGCGGADGYGRPMCSCGDGCSCEQCNHLRHRSQLTCSVRDCHAPSRVEVKAWGVSHHVARANEINPDLTPETGGDEQVHLDDKPSYTWSRPTCTYAHAKQIIDHDRGWRSESQASRPVEDRLRYEIALYDYEPDSLDLPRILDDLRDVGRFLEHDTRELAKAGCRLTASDVFDAESLLAEARRRAAKLVAALAALSTETPAPRRWGQGTPEPEGVRRVMLRENRYRRNRLSRRPGVSEWEGPTISQVYTWDELTAQGEIVEVPTARLIVAVTTREA